MQNKTEEHFKTVFNNQNEYVFDAATKLGERIIDRAKWCEQTGKKLPFPIVDIDTLTYHAQLLYLGMDDDSMKFSLVDLHDPDVCGRHCYPKYYLGDTRAFFNEIVRELEWIYCIHFIGNE